MGSGDLGSGRTVSVKLGEGKASLISPYLFHLYNRNECFREEEIQELVVAKKYLEFGVSPETVTHSNVVELDSERESLSFAK